MFLIIDKCKEYDESEKCKMWTLDMKHLEMVQFVKLK